MKKPSGKTLVIYENRDPTCPAVKAVAIQTETKIPYVWETYPSMSRVPQSVKEMTDMAVLDINVANRLFSFKKGSLSDVVR